MLCHFLLDNELENVLEGGISNAIGETMRAGRYLKADAGEHSYNINDIYADLLLTPLEKVKARVNVVGSKIPSTLDKSV